MGRAQMPVKHVERHRRDQRRRQDPLKPLGNTDTVCAENQPAGERRDRNQA